MKCSLAISLLLSNASLSQAMRLNNKFMPDIDEDNSLVKEVSQMTSISDEDEAMVKSANKIEEDKLKMQEKIRQAHAQVDAKSESEAQSDPIEGSLGHPKLKDKPMNADERLEWELREKKPLEFKVDPLEHPETGKSVKWAENYYKT